MLKMAKLFFLFFISFPVIAQNFNGPVTGTVSPGVTVTTDNFTLRPIIKEPVDDRVKNKHKVTNSKSEIVPNGMPSPVEIYQRDYDLLNSPEDLNGAVIVKNYPGIGMTSSIPPDPHLAVGPNHIVGTVNTSFAIWDKEGNLLKLIAAEPWYNSLIPGGFIFDPKVVYDHFSERWIMVWLDQDDPSRRGNYLVSVSDDDNPLGTWYNWRVPSNLSGTVPSGQWGDYQGVGFDTTALYITSNQFGFTGGFFGAKMVVIPKSSLYNNSTAGFNYYDFWGIGEPGGSSSIYTIRPSISLTASSTYHLLHIPSNFSGNYYNLYKVTYNNGVPQLSGVRVPVTTFFGPPSSSQPGGGMPLETMGPSLNNEPVFHDGFLYVTHAIANPASGSYGAFRYTKVNTTTNLVSEQVSFGEIGYWYLYPSIMVDKNANVAITYTRSGTTEFPSAYYTAKSANSSFFTPSRLIEKGKASYIVDYGSGRNRWGDYLGIAVDPVDMESIWMLTQFAPAKNTWSTRLAEVRMIPFNGVKLNAPASVTFGDVENQTAAFRNFTIVNHGSEALIISSLDLTNPVFSITNLPSFPVTLNSFDSLNINMRVLPQTTGEITAQLQINSNDPLSNPVELKVKSYEINNASANTIYAVSSQVDGGKVYIINKFTGEAVFLGNSGYLEMLSLRVNPADDVIYGMRSKGFDSSWVYRVNSELGDAYSLTWLDKSPFIASAIDTGGNYFLLDKDGNIYEADISSGVTVFRTKSLAILQTIAFHPVTNELYGTFTAPLGSPKDLLLKINLSNGDTTRIGRTGFNKNIRDIFFDENGKLFGLSGNPNALCEFIEIDPVMGSGTLIGNTGVNGLLSVAYLPGEPSSIFENGDLVTPFEYNLNQNYPNPFNPTTNISYSLPENSQVTLKIFNLLGETVQILINGLKEAGSHSVKFEVLNSLPSGVYFYSLEAIGLTTGKEFSSIKKMTLLK